MNRTLVLILSAAVVSSPASSFAQIIGRATPAHGGPTASILLPVLSMGALPPALLRSIDSPLSPALLSAPALPFAAVEKTVASVEAVEPEKRGIPIASTLDRAHCIVEGVETHRNGLDAAQAPTDVKTQLGAAIENAANASGPDEKASMLGALFTGASQIYGRLVVEPSAGKPRASFGALHKAVAQNHLANERRAAVAVHPKTNYTSEGRIDSNFESLRHDVQFLAKATYYFATIPGIIATFMVLDFASKAVKCADLISVLPAIAHMPILIGLASIFLFGHLFWKKKSADLDSRDSYRAFTQQTVDQFDARIKSINNLRLAALVLLPLLIGLYLGLNIMLGSLSLDLAIPIVGVLGEGIHYYIYKLVGRKSPRSSVGGVFGQEIERLRGLRRRVLR